MYGIEKQRSFFDSIGVPRVPSDTMHASIKKAIVQLDRPACHVYAREAADNPRHLALRDILRDGFPGQTTINVHPVVLVRHTVRASDAYRPLDIVPDWVYVADSEEQIRDTVNKMRAFKSDDLRWFTDRYACIAFRDSLMTACAATTTRRPLGNHVTEISVQYPVYFLMGPTHTGPKRTGTPSHYVEWKYRVGVPLVLETCARADVSPSGKIFMRAIVPKHNPESYICKSVWMPQSPFTVGNPDAKIAGGQVFQVQGNVNDVPGKLGWWESLETRKFNPDTDAVRRNYIIMEPFDCQDVDFDLHDAIGITFEYSVRRPIMHHASSTFYSRWEIEGYVNKSDIDAFEEMDLEESSSISETSAETSDESCTDSSDDEDVTVKTEPGSEPEPESSGTEDVLGDDPDCPGEAPFFRGGAAAQQQRKRARDVDADDGRRAVVEAPLGPANAEAKQLESLIDAIDLLKGRKRHMTVSLRSKTMCIEARVDWDYE